MSLLKFLVRHLGARAGSLSQKMELCMIHLYLFRPVPLMGSAGVSSNGGHSNGVTGTKGEVIVIFEIIQH